jgi:hypothetical protein
VARKHLLRDLEELALLEPYVSFKEVCERLEPAANVGLLVGDEGAQCRMVPERPFHERVLTDLREDRKEELLLDLKVPLMLGGESARDRAPHLVVSLVALPQDDAIGPEGEDEGVLVIRRQPL